ncbi:MAG: GNAT family N-acetyltransferase [Pseudomonadota bacterium]
MKLWSDRKKVPVDVWYLQMFEAPPPPPTPAANVRIMRLEEPTVAFYRYLYDRVGREWHWFERLKLDDAALGRLIGGSGVEINVLYVGGGPAGFAELDVGTGTDIEVAYFGLMSEFIGRGLGGYFLRWALHRAWQHKPARVWLHTCSMDHPHALPNYQKAGLTVYRKEHVVITDPREQFPHLGSA